MPSKSGLHELRFNPSPTVLDTGQSSRFRHSNLRLTRGLGPSPRWSFQAGSWTQQEAISYPQRKLRCASIKNSMKNGMFSLRKRLGFTPSTILYTTEVAECTLYSTGYRRVYTAHGSTVCLLYRVRWVLTVQGSLSVHCAGFAECTLYRVRCGKCRFRTGNFASEASYTTIGKFKQNFRNRFLKNFTKTKGSCDFLKYLMHKTMQEGKEDGPPPPQTPGNRVRDDENPAWWRIWPGDPAWSPCTAPRGSCLPIVTKYFLTHYLLYQEIFCLRFS